MKKLYLAVLLSLVSLFNFRVAHAGYTCEVREETFNVIKKLIDGVDLGTLVVGQVHSLIVDGTAAVTFGESYVTVQKCGLQKAGITDIPEQCRITEEECVDINSTGFYPGTNTYSRNGSLLGFTNLVSNSLSEPMPVDAAYAWNRMIEPVPYARTALAAPQDYSGPLLTFVYDVWVVVRDISLSLLAVVMLVVGIMIITRKKLNPQASVTIQLALPRIVMAVLLIFFSYTIGAVGASISYNLRWGVEDFVNNISFSKSNVEAIDEQNTIGSVIAILLSILAFFQVGIFVLAAYAVGSLIAFILFLRNLIKMAMIYGKILISIIVSPISFVLGAIPGNEATTINWFKVFIAHVFSIPAMWLIMKLSWSLVWYLAKQMLEETNTHFVFSLFGAAFFATLVAPVFLIIGLNYAHAVPEKIQNVIVGEEKPKRR